MKPIHVLRVAAGQLDSAYAWYEREEPGLGLRFNVAIDECLASISSHPRSFLRLPQFDARRAMVKRFPYHVYFREFDDVVAVIAVLHARQDAVAALRRRRRGESN